jgi:aminobenzoyl-glutamate utilization protein B
VPTIRLRFPSNIPGVTGHHWSSGIAMATPIAHKGANHGARVVAMTAIDLLTDAPLLERAKAYFRDVQTKETKWTSLIPRGTPPATHLNEERMARYRPMLEKLRYDPGRYPTYLDQLGIAYPTLQRPQ